MITLKKCNVCKKTLENVVLDLGMQPLCESFIEPEKLNDMEPHFPLKVYVCAECFLVQVPKSVSPETIYLNYKYYSSFSNTWLSHVKQYTENIIKRFGIGKNNLVAEIASNDGYLLQYFVEKGIPVIGIDPSEEVAQYAINKKGIRTEIKFFGVETSGYMVDTYGQADLIIGNNILAHVPDINDFVQGLKNFLKPGGIITMEFPHLLRLIEENQFDTIYHEHFSYLSFTIVRDIFRKYDIKIFDVEELPTHGGSLRIYGCHLEDETKTVHNHVIDIINREETLGMNSLAYYSSFNEKVKATKRDILAFLIQEKNEGKHFVGYGAPGKGNTLLNYCGIRTDFFDYVVDINPNKHGNYLPGSHIPIYHPDIIKETKPEYVVILPWNLKDEIVNQHNYIFDWEGKFVLFIPKLTIIG